MHSLQLDAIMPKKTATATRRKKKLPVEDPAKKESRRKLIGEIIGIVLFALAIFMTVSLVSIDPSDPSFNAASGSVKIKNYGGIVGAYFADILYQVFGYSSLIMPFFLVMIAIRRFRRDVAPHRLVKVCCSLLLFAEIMVLLRLRWSYADPFERGLTYKTGGVIGDFLRTTLVANFNLIGSYIFVFSVMGITLLLLTGISIQSVVARMNQHTSNLTKRCVDMLSGWGLPLTAMKDGFMARFSPPIGESAAESPVKDEELDSPMDDDEISVAEPELDEGNGPPIRERLDEPVVREQIQPKKPAKSEKSRSKSKKEQKFVQEEFPFVNEIDEYVLPSLGLLDDPSPRESIVIKRELTTNAQVLVEKLKTFGVEGRITQIFPGPVITRYEFEPDPGIKISRITGLSDDLGLAMKAKVSPIVAAVPGKSVVGIEIPNQKREMIMLKEIINSDAYTRNPSKLKLALGKDTSGAPYVESLASMPHLLVAGATGAGKSVCIHSLLTSLLYSASPEELNMIMIDPKMLELSVYNKIPHLREAVVTDPKKASQALQWAVSEMEERYKLLAHIGVRNIDLYNEHMKELIESGKASETEYPYPLPYLVIVIDELADLMMVAAADVENSIARLAQMARAAGIHLIISTQRPSVNVITGIIKANFPSRIAFQVSSKIDSRTILDVNGAERLLGKGDMLFKPVSGRLIRLHGAFVSEIEVQRIVNFVSQFKVERKAESIFRIVAKKKQREEPPEQQDELYDRAVRIIVNSGNASISMLQRRLRIGHSRAARLMDIMEQEGVVGPFEGSKPRDVLLKPEELPPLEDLFYEDDETM